MRRTSEKTAKMMMIAVILLALFCAGIYGNFIARRITQESERHLQENYSRENQDFLDMIEKNEAMLRETAWFVEDFVDAGDLEKLHTLIEKSQDTWGFTKFYFTDYTGEYLTLDGTGGSFSFSAELQLLMRNGQSVVKNVQREEGAHTVIAVPIIPNEYLGFSYTGIAICYDGEDMEALLQLSSYEDRADCYVISPDGEVLFSAATNHMQTQNYLAYLEGNAAFLTGSLRALESALRDNTDGIFEVRIRNVEYYLVYQNVDYRDWSMIGLVPQDVVNGSMSQIQWVTICMLGILFLLVGAALLFLFFQRMERSLYQKNKELHAQKKMLEIVAGGVRDMFVVFSAEDFRVDYVSPNCAVLLGITAKEISEDIRRLGLTAVRPEEDLTVEDLEEIKVGESKSYVRERIHQKTGGRRWFQETLYRRLLDEAERFVLILSERTQEIRERNELQEVVGLTQSVMEAKESFLSNISCDIRTPLQAVLGFSNQLEESLEEPQKARELSKRIVAAGTHLQNMLNDILDISRMESGKVALTLSEFEIGQLLEDIDAAVRVQVRTKRQFYDVRVRGMKGKRLLGDRTRIGQILFHTISNAIQYTQEGGRIELNVTQKGNSSDKIIHLNFRIRDNGIGMEKDYQEQLFEVFTREEDSAMRNHKGIGAGMAITKSLVDLMGGTISVESQKDFGTTVFIDLPLRVADDEKNQSFWKINHVTKLLTVDSDAEVHRQIARAMLKTGVKVQGATNGETALQLIEDAKREGEPFDLILLDWKLPGLDGLEVVRHIRGQVGEEVPILMLTTYDWEDIEQAAREIGVDGFLTKPFFTANLRYILRQMQNQQKDSEISTDAAGNVLRGLRILSIERDGLYTENFYELLRAEGAECEFAKNDLDGIESFRESIPGYYDLILLDIRRMELEGTQTAASIRRSVHPEAKRIPILALTEDDFVQTEPSDVNAYLPQSADMEQTHRILAQLLHKKYF